MRGLNLQIKNYETVNQTLQTKHFEITNEFMNEMSKLYVKEL